MDALCCICEANISSGSGSNKVKRKLLTARAELQTRKVLNDLFIESHGITITTFLPYLKVLSAISETPGYPGVLLDDYMQSSVPDPPAALRER